MHACLPCQICDDPRLVPGEDPDFSALEAAAAAIPGAAAADVTTIAAFLEGLDDSYFGDDLDALGGA